MRQDYPDHRLNQFPCLTEEDRERFRTLGGPPFERPRHSVIRPEGGTDRSMYLLVDGWALSCLVLPTGERLIVKLHLPGDVLGSTSLATDGAIDSVIALTPVVVQKVPLRDFGALMASSPRVATFMLLSVQQERIALIDRLAAVARSNATASVAWFLLDLNARLKAIGKSHGDSFESMITQEQIGDLLGLTAVHVNRTINQMERDGALKRDGFRKFALNVSMLNDMATLPQRRMSRDVTWFTDHLAENKQG